MRLFLLLSLFGLSDFVGAQTAVRRIKTPEAQVQEVKQLDDFYDRFNADRLPNGEKAPDSLKKSAIRSKYIEKLVNSEDTRWQKGAGHTKFSRFLLQVCDDTHPIFLNKFDDQIYSVASCSVTYFSSNSLADLLFRRKTNQEMHYWVLQGASDTFMEQFEQKIEQRSLVPNAHETNFLSLSNQLHAGTPLRSYTDSSFRFDALSAFVFAVDSRLVKFNECDRVTVFITGVKGWVLKLEDYTRDQGNTGWLISDLIETKDEPLTQLLLHNR